MRRHDYLKNHRPAFYTMLLTSGKPRTHLREIDVSARERWELIIKQMMEAQGVTEQLKAEDAMLWVAKVICFDASYNRDCEGENIIRAWNFEKIYKIITEMNKK